MLKRILIALILAAVPMVALADDAAPTVAAPTPATTATPAGDNTATSAGLGPDSISPSAGGSNADSAALQPAGTSPIQSGATDATGLTAPANALQAPAASSNQLKVLSGEADGTPHQLSAQSSESWAWPAAAFVAMLTIAGAVILRDRRRFGRVDI